MRRMFYGCRNLKEINFTGLDLSKVEDITGIFSECRNIKRVEFPPNLNIHYALDILSGCIKIEYIKLPLLDGDVRILVAVLKEGREFNKIIPESCEFVYFTEGEPFIEGIAVGNMDNGSVLYGDYRDEDNSLVIRAMEKIYVNEDSSCMFRGLRYLLSVVCDNFDTSKVTDMGEMFCDCVKVDNIDCKHWDTSNVVRFDNMFRRCKSLFSVDISNWSTQSAEYTYGMFEGCTALKRLDLEKFKIDKVIDSSNMFKSVKSMNIK